MTPDELKSIPKREFVVMKTGHPSHEDSAAAVPGVGDYLGEPYQMPEQAARKVVYARKRQLTQAIIRKKRGTTPPANQDRGQSDYNTALEV